MNIVTWIIEAYSGNETLVDAGTHTVVWVQNRLKRARYINNYTNPLTPSPKHITERLRRDTVQQQRKRVRANAEHNEKESERRRFAAGLRILKDCGVEGAVE